MSARASRILLVFSTFLLLGSLALQWAPPLLYLPPGTQVRCKTPEWDAGSVFPGDEVETSFVIENTGRTAVTVTGLKASCGCTTVPENVDGRRIEAGQSLTIPVKWTASAVTGKQSKQVNVLFAEWKDWSLPLKIEGEVLPMWEATPDQLSLGTLAPDADVTRTVQVTFTEGSPVKKADRAQCSHKQLRATVEPSAEGTGAAVVVRTIPPLPPGRLATNIYVHMSGQSLTIPVVAFVEDDASGVTASVETTP
ncbi:MAG TPA: DUF1573 domain-containing protein [Planctomycetaceae bacterium]|nr:DUF1573 domain-containing protein [Planctomycetaceae bacterium]